MLKPASLRAVLEATLPELKRNPDRLLVFANEGSIRCTSAASLSFEYAYTLQVIVTDYGRDADTLMVPILAWVAANQPELLANPERQPDGIRFEADLLNHTTMDLAVSLMLTERVIVQTHADGSYTTEHAPEPEPVWETMQLLGG
jgi:hypothetical protein